MPKSGYTPSVTATADRQRQLIEEYLAAPDEEVGVVLIEGLDFSGSFTLQVENMINGSRSIAAEVARDRSLAPRVYGAYAAMSGYVVSSQIDRLDRVRFPDIVAGGGSPHGQLLREMSRLSASARPLMKSFERVIEIRIIIADGYTSDFTDGPVAQFRSEQDEHCHTFVVALGDVYYEKVLKSFSVGHDILVFKDLERGWEDVSNAILSLVKLGVKHGAEAVARTPSLNPSEIRARMLELGMSDPAQDEDL